MFVLGPLVLHLFLLLVHSCLARLCYFLLHSDAYPCILSRLDLLPMEVTPEHWIKFPGPHGGFSVVIYLIHRFTVYICQSQPSSSLRCPFPPPCPYVCSLSLCLYFCFANRFISTIFYIPHIYMNIWYFFFSS